MDSIQKLADEFEDEWFVGNRPDLRDFLGRVDKEQRDELLNLLLPIDVEYRRKANDDVKAMDYDDLGSAGIEMVGSLLAPSQNDSSTADADNQIGQQIGDYRLIELIGEGGMGAVYRAVQNQHVRREVALKIIKSGLDSKEVIVRFEAERQAVAMMDHPNIARVLDAGTTDLGQPYFAMELVRGIPLTTYCDVHQLGIRDRLGLFIQICRGVQHAHQKGIIHRDLKPANILVAEYNGQPVPKVIDFGLAKALDTEQRLTDKSVFTEFGQVLGTLKYMSPEQAGLDSLDIDTRSDIYALGVILYELLTGQTPLDDDSFKGKALLKILELVRDMDSPRPSSQLSTTKKESLEAITKDRRTDIKRLGQILAGDLDWIVMKALDRDRNGRYNTASGFAEDVDRYLNGQPIEARPPSVGYRFQKFVRRNRRLVSVVATVMALLIAGVAGTTTFAMRARDSAEQSATILKIVTDSFQSVNPESGADSTMMAKDVLVNALGLLEKSELNDEGRQILLEKLSACFQGLGEFDLAISASRQTIQIADGKEGDLEEKNQAVSKANLATALLGDGQVDEAIELYKESLGEMRRTWGNEHENTLTAIHALANAYRQAGDLRAAIPLLEESLRLGKSQIGEEEPQVISYMNNLAMAYRDAGNLEKSASLYEETLVLAKSVLGEDHPNTLTTMTSLAMTHYALGKLPKARTLLEAAVTMSVKKLGEAHPNTLTSKLNLSTLLLADRQIEKAIELLGELIPLCKDSMGAEHPVSLSAKLKLGEAYHLSGRSVEALNTIEPLSKQFATNLGEMHPKTLAVANLLGVIYTAVGRHEDSLNVLHDTLERCRQTLGVEHPFTLGCKLSLAASLRSLGKQEEAIPYLEESFGGYEKTLGEKHPKTLAAMGVLGTTYIDVGRVEEGTVLLRRTVELKKSTLGETHKETLSTIQILARAMVMQDKLDDAKSLLIECLDRQVKKDSQGWEADTVRIQLGGVLLAQKDFEGALKHLRAGYRGMSKPGTPIPPAIRKQQLSKALEGLISLANATEREAIVPKLQQKLEELNAAETNSK